MFIPHIYPKRGHRTHTHMHNIFAYIHVTVFVYELSEQIYKCQLAAVH